MHVDEDVYPSSKEFVASRFEAMRDPSNPGKTARVQMISTNPEYILFGFGKHACPGRFFAVNELKVIISHLILNYEVKFEKQRDYPPPSWSGQMYVPNQEAEIMIRKKQI
jgi:cytochrome P450